ncbi:hypothetical protein [Nannocystis sp. SCPEA4]|uniref:WD40/YVTN/BNR-like repeat-containing protein n=1 Tax=Nannocystis sp. SCPEA4 TaxID=2996787 RepID=UPI00226FA603|nr:hypothetical protein [Nannocystis sp. SCPEA4]MCY1060454.1 hypothetical protein [Nannocystis sp. SCPEA4]
MTFQVAVGLGGAIAEFDDRYEPRESGTTEDLLAVSAARENLAAPFVAVGRRGTIVAANGPGEPWKPHSLEDVATDLRGVAYTTYPQEFGLAVGDAGTVVIGESRGTRWHRVVSPTAQRLNAAAIDYEGRAIVVGDRGTIVSTPDQGTSWEVVESPTTEDLLSILIDSVGPVPPEAEYVYSGYIVGTSGTLLYSPDGMSWEKVDTGVTEDLRQVLLHVDNSDWKEAALILGETRLYAWEPGTPQLRLKHELRRPIYSIGEYLSIVVALVEPGEILRFREPFLCDLPRD